jgi:dTMP kinase
VPAARVGFVSRGWFVALEGGEGAGKSTQAALLVEHLMRTRPELEVVVSREPGGTKAAEALRTVVLSPEYEGLAPRAEALVFAAARGDHAHQVIRPGLERGALVLLDRYLDSSVVYQGIARGLGEDEVEHLSLWATNNLQPDLVIVIDVDPAHSMARFADRDRMESEPIDFHERVRAGFLHRAAKQPDRFVVVDGSREVGEVSADVIAAVEGLLAQ